MSPGIKTGQAGKAPGCSMFPARRNVLISHASRILAYVTERRCPSGGYCFYQLDEPNAADTCRALIIRNILGSLQQDLDTVEFLRSLQSPGGSFSSLSAGYAALLALSLLGEAPDHDPGAWIHSLFRVPAPGREVIEVLSPFEHAHTWVALCRLCSVDPTPEETDLIGKALRSHRCAGGGFGTDSPNLLDTWHVTRTLRLLGYEIDRVATAAFLKRCENPDYGFLNAPGVLPPYLEHLHAGVLLSRELGITPRFHDECIAFLDRCFHRSGGFVRSVFGGSPTLEFTAYAVIVHAGLEGRAHIRGIDL